MTWTIEVEADGYKKDFSIEEVNVLLNAISSVPSDVNRLPILEPNDKSYLTLVRN